MNRDDVIRMAHEADLLDPQHYGSIWEDKIEAFYKLLASHVAEECAKHYEAMKFQEFFGDQIAEEIRSLYKPTA